MKQPIPTEHAEQVTFVNAFRERYPGLWIFAIPNGGLRNILTAQKLKLEGVSKGVPDLFIPALCCWVEMKRIKGGSVSPEQKDWIEYLEGIGQKVIIAPGYLSALEQVEEFIDSKASLQAPLNTAPQTPSAAG